MTHLHPVPTPGPAAPPHDLDAEAAVIGCALLSGNVVEPCRVEEGLSADRFYRDRHRLVWQAILDIVDQGDEPDVLAVSDLLDRRGQLEQAGGRTGIDAMTGYAPSIGNARRYAAIVVDTWKWRTRLTGVFGAEAAVHERSEDAFHAAISTATGTTVHATADPSPRSVSERVGRRLVEARADATTSTPLPLPWPGLERQRFRMRPGQTTVLASWTSFGKSWVGLELAAHTGQRLGTGAAVIWTNEMSEDELVARQVQRDTGIPAERMLDAEHDDQPEEIARALRRLPFGVAECFGWDAGDIARHIRHVRPRLAVLDHFHQLPGVSDRETADEAVRVLVDAARQTGVHLVLVSQLNHARDLQEIKPPPARRDLRGTGNLQSLPNNIMFLHRDQERDPETKQVWLEPTGTLHVDKQRGGPDHRYQSIVMFPDRMTVRERA